jgi:hypothetical protein
MLADVAQPGRAQQGIGDGVQQHVGIGMAEQAEGMGDGHAADDEFAAGNESVDVIALADADLRHVDTPARAASKACASSRSGK